MSDVEGDAAGREGRTQTGKALLLVVVVALIAVLVLRHTGPSALVKAATTAPSGPTTTTTTTTAPKVAPKPTTTTTTPVLPPAQITVEVLNGLQSGSLASNLSARLDADGYHTMTPDNTTSPTSTTVIYLARRGLYREARILASKLGLPPTTIDRNLPATAPVPGGSTPGRDLIVVIGTSLESLASAP